MADRNVKIDVDADVSRFNRGMASAAASAKAFNAAIDKSNDRTVWLAQSITGLGPALVPLGGAGLTAIAGLTTQLTVAGVAAGATAIAFNGIGDALGALNDYQVEPTEANLRKLSETMDKIGPAGQEFVYYLDSLGPALSELSNATRSTMLPGFTDGLQAMMERLPQFRQVIVEVAEGVGELARSSGEGLAGPGFERFFAYLDDEAKPILLDMGATLGKFIQGTADLLVSFGPLTERFSKGFADMANSYAEWAAGTGDSQSFQAFLDYLSDTGPKVLDFLGELATTLGAIIKAAAPIGGAVLEGVTGFLNVLEGIANTPLGPILIGMASLVGIVGRLSALGNLVGGGAIGGIFAGMSGGMVATTQAAKTLRPSMREVGTAMLYAAHSQDTLKKSMASGSNIAAQSAKNALLAKTQVNAFAKSAAPAAAGLALMGASLTGASESMGLVNTTSLAMAGLLIGPWGAAVGGAAGLLLDMKSANDQAAASERATTEAIKSGSAERIAARLAEVQARANEKNDRWFSFMGPDQGGAMTNTGQEIAQLAAADKAARASLALTRSELAATYGSDVARIATQSVEEFTNAVQAANAVLSNRASMRDYQAALDEIGKSIKDNGRTLDINTEAGRKNQAALDRVAAVAIKAAADMEPLKGARFLQRAEKDFIAAARQMGMSRQAARNLAEQLFALDKIDPKVRVELLGAERAVIEARRIQTAINSIRGRNITNYVNYVQRGGAGRQMGGVPMSADGSTVPKDGGPYADRYPYLLAPGEEVISNRHGQADRHRDLLKAINANRLADGGTVGLANGGTAKKNKFTTSEYRSASRNFDLTGQQTWVEVRKELRAFAKEVRKAGGSVGKNFGKLSRQAEQTAKGIQTHSRTLGSLRSRQADARSTAAGSFNNNPFTGSLADFVTQTTADRNDSRGMTAALAAAKKKGLDGSLAAALAGSGNLELARQFASASKADITRYEQLYTQRTQSQNALGNVAATYFTPAINRQVSAIKDLTKRLNNIEAAVERGARRGVADKNKNTSNRAKGK